MMQPARARSAPAAACCSRQARKRARPLLWITQLIHASTCPPAICMSPCALPYFSLDSSRPNPNLPHTKPRLPIEPLWPRPTAEPEIPVHQLRQARHRPQPHRPPAVTLSARSTPPAPSPGGGAHGSEPASSYPCALARWAEGARRKQHQIGCRSAPAPGGRLAAPSAGPGFALCIGACFCSLSCQPGACICQDGYKCVFLAQPTHALRHQAPSLAC